MTAARVLGLGICSPVALERILRDDDHNRTVVEGETVTGESRWAGLAAREFSGAYRCHVIRRGQGRGQGQEVAR